jgi:hypothetical protein
MADFDFLDGFDGGGDWGFTSVSEKPTQKQSKETETAVKHKIKTKMRPQEVTQIEEVAPAPSCRKNTQQISVISPKKTNKTKQNERVYQ